VTWSDRWAALKVHLAREGKRFFASSTLWVSYAMIAWPEVANALDQDHQWLTFLPAAWRDKSVSVLGLIVWAARMRSRLPKRPAAASP
jgi:hypothetical protein